MRVLRFMALLFQLLCSSRLVYGEQGPGRTVASGAPCTSGPMGMESGAIPDSSITASSYYYEDYGPQNARLNVEQVGWIPRTKEGQWIQVDLGDYTAVTGVIMQGYRTTQYVRSFSITYSNTGTPGDWKNLSDEDKEVIKLNGNNESEQPVTATFPEVVMARFLRILPLTWSESRPYALRFEVLGCRDAVVRLVGGDAAWSGRVEVYRKGSWGVVCDNKWDIEDATAVCRQLGFHIGALEAKWGSFFGESELPIVMNRVACKGTESRLADCPFFCTSPHQCNNSREAGVVCIPNTIRLVGGSNHTSGRVEIRRDGRWGTICDNDWNILAASVVCRQLGFPCATEAKSGAYFGQGQGRVHMDGVACDGSESQITDCPSLCWEEPRCNHTQDAGVICRGDG